MENRENGKSENPSLRAGDVKSKPIEDFEGITVYDNGEITADRYTVIFPTGDTYGMSRDADMPNGVCMYIGHKDSICIDHTIEKRIDINSLPEGVKKQIKYLLRQEVVE